MFMIDRFFLVCVRIGWKIEYFLRSREFDELLFLGRIIL